MKPGHVRPARREGEQEPQVRRLGPAPVPGAGEPEADPEGAVAERRPHLAPPVRDVARQVVRAEEHPGLDHRVRQRDEAGRAEGRHGVAAGDLRDPGDRHREEGQAGADVHLVRDADSAGSLWQSGIYRNDGRREAVTAEVRRRGGAAEPGQRQAERQGRDQEPRPSRSTCDRSARTTRSGRRVGITSRTTLGREARRLLPAAGDARDRLHRRRTVSPA